MAHTISPSPTGDLDQRTVARFRGRDTWLDFDRHQAGLPELLNCDKCEVGIVQRVAVDYDPDCGVSYEATAGCSMVSETCWIPLGGQMKQFTDKTWRCPACTFEASRTAA
jgi:hypothetical protein